MSERGDSCRLGPRGVTLLGMAVNGLLGVIKVLVGILFHSRILVADGLHSASDLVSDLAVLGGLKMTDKPADDCHPYGHRRVGTMAAMFVGAAVTAAAIWIAYDAMLSLRKVFAPGEIAPVGLAWPIVIEAASIVLKEVLFRLTRAVGRRTKNLSIEANAWHHRSDAFSSLAALAGLAGLAVGGPGWRFLDPVTAIVLASFVLVVGVRIILQSASELVDRAPAGEQMTAIRRIVADSPGVKDFHAVRARKVGGMVEMDVHVEVDANLTVREGHEIASRVKHRILDSDADVKEVIVHIEPAKER